MSEQLSGQSLQPGGAMPPNHREQLPTHRPSSGALLRSLKKVDRVNPSVPEFPRMQTAVRVSTLVSSEYKPDAWL